MGWYRIKIFLVIGSLLLVPRLSGLLYAGEAGLFTVRFATSGRTASDWPLYVAKEKKIFQKNALRKSLFPKMKLTLI